MNPPHSLDLNPEILWVSSTFSPSSQGQHPLYGLQPWLHTYLVDLGHSSCNWTKQGALRAYLILLRIHVWGHESPRSKLQDLNNCHLLEIGHVKECSKGHPNLADPLYPSPLPKIKTDTDSWVRADGSFRQSVLHLEPLAIHLYGHINSIVPTLHLLTFLWCLQVSSLHSF